MRPAAPQLDLCPACGQQGDSDVACTRCGASLLVDLWLEGPPSDERTRFFAARDVAALSIGVALSDVRRGLADRERPVATGLPRAAARAAIGALARHGIAAHATPPAPPPRAPARRAPLGAAAGLAILVALGVGLWAGRARHAPAPLLTGEAGAAAQPGDARAVPGTASTPAAPASAAAAGPATLTTRDIMAVAVGSVAEVSCGGKVGTAFFVSPEQAATNAHVVCGNDVPVRIRLADGRELVGKVVALEKRIDLAVVEVPGAALKPLELGDSTVLAGGDGVVFVGNPNGLAFTVHEGKVSYVGRNMYGTAYLQMNASVNPGNSGGPLLDGRGRAVGIVSMKVAGDGIGLALPIEYLRPLLPRLAAASVDAQARWHATLDRVRREDAAEVDRYRARYQKPTVVAVGVGPGGLYAAVLRRWSFTPGHLSITVDIRDGGRTVCSADAAADDWERAEESLDKALRDAPDQPRLVWASENRLLRDVFMSTVALDLGRCVLADIPASAVVIARGGDESDAPVRFPKPSLVEASERRADAEARARRDAEERQAARQEVEWRRAFRQLRSAIASLEARRTQLRASVADSVPTSDPRDPRRQLADVEAQLAKTRDALDDLDRRASLASVPRSWRE
jgi:serine protease Do